MNKEAIENRLKELVGGRLKLQNQMADVQADINAHNGAIQDCEYWLKILEDAPKYTNEEAKADEL